MSEQLPTPQEKFKQKMKDQGLKEIRGAYAPEAQHAELKKIMKAYEPNRIEIMLFINSLQHPE